MQTYPHFLRQVFPKCNTKHYSVTTQGGKKGKESSWCTCDAVTRNHSCMLWAARSRKTVTGGCHPASMTTTLPAQNSSCSPHTWQKKPYCWKGWGKPQPLGTGEISPKPPPMPSQMRTLPHSQLSLFHTKSRRKQMSQQAFDSEKAFKCPLNLNLGLWEEVRKTSNIYISLPSTETS